MPSAYLRVGSRQPVSMGKVAFPVLRYTEKRGVVAFFLWLLIAFLFLPHSASCSVCVCLCVYICVCIFPSMNTFLF